VAFARLLWGSPVESLHYRLVVFRACPFGAFLHITANWERFAYLSSTLTRNLSFMAFSALDLATLSTRNSYVQKAKLHRGEIRPGFVARNPAHLIWIVASFWANEGFG
jgi:hypothetical protein